MQPLSSRYCRNYLRACGEYSEPNRVAVAAWELPPRARRIRFPPVVFLLPVVVLTHVSGVVSGVTP